MFEKNNENSEDSAGNSAIIIVLDGLHSAFSGPYGNSWISTPQWDRFACDSMVFDRYYVNSLDLNRIYGAYWCGLHPGDELLSPESKHEEESPCVHLPKELREQGYRTILITDDSRISYGLYTDGFSEIHLLETPEIQELPTDIEETQFYRVFASALDRIPRSEPYFLWIHLRGFGGNWDFPMDFRMEYVDEGDPPPYPGTKQPVFDYRLLQKSRNPQEPTDPDPDELRSVVESYAGGITLFDEILGGFLESLSEIRGASDSLIVLTSSRGFSMGEHRFIGFPEPDSQAGRGNSSLLWGENIHLPLMMKFPDGSGKMNRSSALVQTNDVFATLADWFGLAPFAGFPEHRNFREEIDEEKPIEKIAEETLQFRSLLAIISGERDSVRDYLLILESGDSGPRGFGMVSEDWFFHRTVQYGEFSEQNAISRLYVKPGDRFEVNQVADRCEDVVESFENILNGICKIKVKNGE